MTKELTIKTLQLAYNTLAENNLLAKHKELTNALQEALDALGATVQESLKKGTDFSKGTENKANTEVKALAGIHNMLFLYNVDDSITEEQVSAFYSVPFYALKALERAKSTCKEDTEAKLEAIRIELKDDTLDELERTILRVLEYELTGTTSEWGKQSTPQAE